MAKKLDGKWIDEIEMWEEIFNEYVAGSSLDTLAKNYPVSKSTIRRKKAEFKGTERDWDNARKENKKKQSGAIRRRTKEKILSSVKKQGIEHSEHKKNEHEHKNEHSEHLSEHEETEEEIKKKAQQELDDDIEILSTMASQIKANSFHGVRELMEKMKTIEVKHASEASALSTAYKRCIEVVKEVVGEEEQDDSKEFTVRII